MYTDWLDEETPPPVLKGMIGMPYPTEKMHTYEVSTLVNKANLDQPEMIEPITPPQQSMLM
jgi:putative SOS response-associated peptidase YedK